MNAIPLSATLLNAIPLKRTVYKNSLKCEENTKSTILLVSRAIKGEIMILPKCVVCGDKKSKFIQKQEENGLLSATLLNNLVIRKQLNAISLSETPILKDILF